MFSFAFVVTCWQQVKCAWVGKSRAFMTVTGKHSAWNGMLDDPTSTPKAQRTPWKREAQKNVRAWRRNRMSWDISGQIWRLHSGAHSNCILCTRHASNTLSWKKLRRSCSSWTIHRQLPVSRQRRHISLVVQGAQVPVNNPSLMFLWTTLLKLTSAPPHTLW